MDHYSIYLLLGAGRLLGLLSTLGDLLLHGVRQLLRQLAGPLGKFTKGQRLAIRSARTTRHSLVKVSLEAVPQQHKKSGLRTTYRVLAAKVRDGGRVRAKQLRQLVKGGRRLRLGKHAAVEAGQRILCLRQEAACLATDTLQGNQSTLQIFGKSLAATARRSAQVP